VLIERLLLCGIASRGWRIGAASGALTAADEEPARDVGGVHLRESRGSQRVEVFHHPEVRPHGIGIDEVPPGSRVAHTRRRRLRWRVQCCSRPTASSGAAGGTTSWREIVETASRQGVSTSGPDVSGSISSAITVASTPGAVVCSLSRARSSAAALPSSRM
jgi:hypothetical protein